MMRFELVGTIEIECFSLVTAAS